MRNGILSSLVIVCLTTGAAFAQMPSPYYPSPPGFAAPPPLLIGGALQASGAIALPSMRGGSLLRVSAVPDVVALPHKSAQHSTNAEPPEKTPPRSFAIRMTKEVAGAPTSAHFAHSSNEFSNSVSVPQPPVVVEGDVPPEVVYEACAAEPRSYVPPEVHHQDHYPTDPRPMQTPPGYRYYGSADYLFMWISPQEAPPLLAVGAAPATATAVVGDGQLSFDNGERTGGRFTIGRWFGNRQIVGVEGNYLFLGAKTAPVTVPSDGINQLIRPFIDANNNTRSGVVVADPGISEGSSRIETFSRLQGAELNLRTQWLSYPSCGYTDVLAGFRFLHLDEHLQIHDETQFANVPVFLSQADVFVNDYFGTQNLFYGGQLGLQTQLEFGRVYLNLWGKCALGSMRQTVQIRGDTTIIAPAVPVGNLSAPGGVLAQASNSGNFNRDQFAVIPEAGIKVGFRLTDYLRFSAGYSFLYINNVARPGEQIDIVVNPTQVPVLFQGPLTGPARPVFLFSETDFWAHGLNVEMEYRF